MTARGRGGGDGCGRGGRRTSVGVCLVEVGVAIQFANVKLVQRLILWLRHICPHLQGKPLGIGLFFKK
jgi:hypothetical protein